ncbi:MAG: hypothetical protein ACI9LY_003614 [Arenicella sp.]|jgi:hypothetical protein
MNRAKKLSALLFAGVIGITLLMGYGAKLGSSAKLCKSTVLGSIMPWDSACFYSAIFQKQNPAEDVYYEKYRLDIFSEKGGLAPGVLWYRSNFNRAYKDVFDVDLETIDTYHWEYQDSQPYEIKELMVYINFLFSEDTPYLGQAALNKYCDKYLSKTRFKKIGFSAIQDGLKVAPFEVSTTHCSTYIN